MFGFARKLVKQAEGIIAPDIESTQPTHGFRVLHVEPGSESFHAKIEPFFDFIVAVNGRRFDRQYLGTSAIAVEHEKSPCDEFEQELQATQERLVLELWCAKGKTTRLVTLPNPNKQDLGISVRWSQLSVADHVWHILNVVPTSPADQAGLVSHADYIVAAENGLLEDGGEYLLGKVVSRANPSEGVLFYVYNRDYDVVRPVRVYPSFDGKLGCGVGYGFLHALPPAANSQIAPGATVFDDQTNEAFLDKAVHVPLPPPMPVASTANTAPVAGSAHAANPAAPPPPAAPRAAHHKTAPASDLNEYFNEQSRISREIDGDSSAPVKVAPPPKSS